jgi:hypothetical protein
MDIVSAGESKEMANEVIIKNRAFCKLCRVEVESKTVHDFVSCECGNLTVVVNTFVAAFVTKALLWILPS